MHKVKSWINLNNPFMSNWKTLKLLFVVVKICKTFYKLFSLSLVFLMFTFWIEIVKFPDWISRTKSYSFLIDEHSILQVGEI